MPLSKPVTRLAIGASLIAITSASPLVLPEDDLRLHSSRAEPKSIEDKDSWCRLAEELDKFETAEQALSGTALGGTLDIYIMSVAETSDAWLENIKRYVDDDENISKENAKDCSDLGKECNILNGASCRDFFRGPKEPNNQWNNELWWIFRAVEGAHGKMQKLYNSLTEKTINTHLKMDQIAEDFEESKKAMISGGEAAEWISAVLGAGVGTLGLSSGATPGLGYAMDLLTSGVEMARSETAEEEELVSLADVKSSLADLFLKSRESLAFIARTAVGKPYQQDRDKAKAGGYSMWNRLPNFGEDYWDSQVANFYDNPFWLMDDTAEDVSSVIQVATEPLNVHVTDAVLRQLGYAVSWQSTISNKADCAGGMRQWLNVADKGRCFTFVNGKDTTYTEVAKDSDLLEKMKKHGINDLGLYYKNSIDCAKTKCTAPRSIGLDDNSGGLPLCYYSAPVLKSEMHTRANCYNDDLCRELKYEAFWDESVKSGCPE